MIGQEFYRQQSEEARLRFDVIMPHTYFDGTNTNQDSMTVYWRDGFARCGIEFHEELMPKPMPMLYGEYGNYRTCCWHPNSALWHRIRHWTLFFHEGHAISWHTGYSKTYCGPPSNIWLGPEERAFTRILQEFCGDVGAEARPFAPTVAAPQVNGHGLRSNDVVALYLYNTGDQTGQLSGVTVQVDTAFAAGDGYWYQPTTGDTLSTFAFTGPGQVLTAPAFSIDIAAKVHSTVGVTHPRTNLVAQHSRTRPALPHLSRTYDLRGRLLSPRDRAPRSVVTAVGLYVDPRNGTVRRNLYVR
jgi:hypothetical protein